MRNAVGSEVRLAVDATQGYDLTAAVEAGNRLSPYDIMWFEEPIPGEDLDGYRELRQALPMPVAGAEGRSGLGSFREVVESGAMEIIQPDIGRAGGFTEGMRVCELAGGEPGTRDPAHVRIGGAAGGDPALAGRGPGRPARGAPPPISNWT